MSDDEFDSNHRIVLARDAQTISALMNLSVRPEQGGPVYYTKLGIFGKPVKHAIQPSQVGGLFIAMAEAIGGQGTLDAWCERERDRIRAEFRSEILATRSWLDSRMESHRHSMVDLLHEVERHIKWCDLQLDQPAPVSTTGSANRSQPEAQTPDATD